MSHAPFSGVITALITPFDKNQNVDFLAFERLLQSQKKAGIHGVVILGTTGENPTLTEEESENLVLAALEHQKPDFHVYVGTGTNDTNVTIAKSLKYACIKSSSGRKVDGLMVVTPYYNKPNGRCLVNHYNSVAAAVRSTPLCIYNVPGRTGINLLPHTLAQIVQENPNIVAIKEAAGNVNAVAEMRIALDKVGKNEVRILSGDDATFVPALLCGAVGVISVTSHIIPHVMLKMLTCFQQGNVVELQKLHLETYGLNNGVFAVPNPMGVKWMLSCMGMCANYLRAPLYAADEEEGENLHKILVQLAKNGLITDVFERV